MLCNQILWQNQRKGLCRYNLLQDHQCWHDCKRKTAPLPLILPTDAGEQKSAKLPHLEAGPQTLPVLQKSYEVISDFRDVTESTVGKLARALAQRLVLNSGMILPVDQLEVLSLYPVDPKKWR